MADHYYCAGRYFTMMTNVSAEVNREEILSLLNANSHVTSLHLLQVYRNGKHWQRVGLVEVADRESVFRLSSRQYLLKGFSAARHKVISPESKFVNLFKDKSLAIQLDFVSEEKNAVQRVLKFFEKFGDLKISSIKSKAGIHQVVLKASPNFSIRQLTTDLRIRMGDLVVEIDYPEEKVAFDCFSEDKELMQELELLDPAEHRSISERINFFDPSHLDSIAEKAKPVISSLMSTQYQIEDEDDDLSLDSRQNDQSDVVFKPRKEKNANLNEKGNFLLNYFSCPKTKKYIQNKCVFGTDISCLSLFEERPSKELRDDTKVLTASKTNKSSVKFSEEAMETEIRSVNQHPTNTDVRSQKNSRNRKRKRGGKKGSNSIYKQAQDIDIPDTGIYTPKYPQTHRECDSAFDGSRLLAKITCLPVDYDEINSKVMPLVHAKWRRFVEIKDEMRKVKYHEYLSAKRKEHASTLTDSEMHQEGEIGASNEE